MSQAIEPFLPPDPSIHHRSKTWLCVLGVHLFLGVALLIPELKHPPKREPVNAHSPLVASVSVHWWTSPEPIGPVLSALPTDLQADLPNALSHQQPSVSNAYTVPSVPSSELDVKSIQLSEMPGLALQTQADPQPPPLPDQSLVVGDGLGRPNPSFVVRHSERQASLPNGYEPSLRSAARPVALAPIHSPVPVYPELSRRMGEQGTVWITLAIDSQGIPSRVAVKQSSGFYRLDQAAVLGVQHWRFPSIPDSASAGTQLEVPVVFKFSGS